MKKIVIALGAIACFACFSFTKQDTLKVPLGRQDTIASPRDSVIDLGKMPKQKKRGLINNIDTAVSRDPLKEPR
jgi:hypothetical protein